MDPSSISVREAVSSDAEAVFQFLRPFMEAKFLLHRTIDEIAKLTEHGFLAERETKEVAGFAAIEIYSRKMAEIQCLAVAPDCQGKGIGKQLVSHCVERGRQLSVCEIMAITANENLFQQCGFDYSLPNQKRALFIQTQDP